MIQQIKWESIVDLLINAKEHVVLIMPSIHEEWVEILKENPQKRDLKIQICIDNSEEVIRNGYGSYKSIIELKKLNSIIKESKGLRINFVSIDNQSYFLFLESRILSGDQHGYNAIIATNEQAEKIMEIFFSAETMFLENEPIPQRICELDDETLSKIKKAIENNPPDSPDLKRKISTYNTLFQYAELHFEGGNIANKTISIPNTALPFKDAELKDRMKATLKLFGEGAVNKWSELNDIKVSVNKVRERFLTSCAVRKDKSIIKKGDKKEFINAIEEIKLEAESKLLLLKNKMQMELNRAEDTLKEELKNFIKSNQSTEIQKLLFGLEGEVRERRIEQEVRTMLYKAKLPDADKLISKIKIEYLFFELTWEDLSDEKFMSWFESKELLDQNAIKSLANFKDAFPIRK